jgi:hypothetical protein
VLDLVRHWLASWQARSPVAFVLALAIPVVSFVAGLAAILGLPADYFVRKRPPVPQSHPLLRMILRATKNVAGVLLFLMGFVMALPLVPGPGALLMLVGIGLVDFPGKRAAELRLLRQRRVLSPVNKIRARFGRDPLQTAESQGQSVVDSKP